MSPMQSNENGVASSSSVDVAEAAAASMADAREGGLTETMKDVFVDNDDAASVAREDGRHSGVVVALGRSGEGEGEGEVPRRRHTRVSFVDTVAAGSCAATAVVGGVGSGGGDRDDLHLRESASSTSSSALSPLTMDLTTTNHHRRSLASRTTRNTIATTDRTRQSALGASTVTTYSVGSRRSSSLNLRKVPDHILLGPDWEGAEENMPGGSQSSSLEGSEFEDNDGMKKGRSVNGDEGGKEDDDEIRSRKGVLQRTCLRPQFSLRTQLMLSFGIVSALTVLFVMAVSIVMAGATVKSTSAENLESWAVDKAALSARYVSDAFAPTMPVDVVNIILEAARDRFAGYPDAPGYETDSLVPFNDIYTGRRMYPLDAKNLTMDWDFSTPVSSSSAAALVNDDNHREHVQGRWGWHSGYGRLSTVGALFHMQGVCDPNATNATDDPLRQNYHPNCTSENNDPNRGGVVHPVPTTGSIYSRAKDLDPIFKALYESSPNVKGLGIFFANSGAGATVLFPHYEVDHTRSYVSVGCDWMRTPNPYDPSRTIGTEEEIARCHPSGTMVPNNLYNPLERGWCRNLALRPEKVQFVGPFRNAWREHEWLITVGRGMYDRITKTFVGCILVTVFVENISAMLDQVKVSPSSRITLVKWDDQGTVLSSPGWDPKVETVTTAVDDPRLGLGVDMEKFQELKSLIISAPATTSIDDDSKGEEGEGQGGSSLNSASVRRAYEEAVYHDTASGMIVSSYPVPPPPRDYDPATYAPDFMVIVALDETDIFESFYDLDDAVNEEVAKLVVFTIIVGFAGLALLIGIIFAVSVRLTRPLTWMNRVAHLIVNDFGGNENKIKMDPDNLDRDDPCRSVAFRCLPRPCQRSSSGASRRRLIIRTELSDLLVEFKKLVAKFSGDNTAARAVRFRDGQHLTEMRNKFTMFDEFEWLYRARREAGFKFDYGSSSSEPVFPPPAVDGRKGSGGGRVFSEEEDVMDADGNGGDVSSFSPRRCHFGPNVHNVDSGSKSTSATGGRSVALHRGSILGGRIVLHSPLFRWIAGLIVLPLIVLAVTLSAVVLWYISARFGELDEIVRDEYLQLERRAMSTLVRLRAIEAAGSTGRAARDLHLHTRVAGWLLFGGVRWNKVTFTEMLSSASECRLVPWGTCPLFTDAPCDCAWNDRFNPNGCKNYTDSSGNEEVDSRYLQSLYWAGQKSPWPNGDRNFSLNATSPADTEWYDNATIVPGHEKGDSASGHETTYDRLRAISATSLVQLALYNYNTDDDKMMGIYIGFEADGSTLGYSGCYQGGSDSGFFQSTKANGAADLEPDLCPLGSYGYDARCRDWYATGKNVSRSREPPLYITPPYVFGGGTTTAQSCTLPLIDPGTGEHVGQTLIDFMPSAIVTSLSKENMNLVDGGFPVLVTPRADVLGHDTVIGPNYAIGDPGRRIEELVVPHDEHLCPRLDNETDVGNCEETTEFFDIARDMRAGREGEASFSRTAPDGSNERVLIAYTPVNITSYRPVNDSDYARGVTAYNDVVYSLALAQPERELLVPFGDVSDEIRRQIDISIIVLAVTITIATALLLYISSRVTVSITVPVLHLLGLLRNVNRLETKDDFLHPAEITGSREVLAVYDTFSMLFKVIRFANSAFFTGDIERAYRVLVDALKLFKSLDNKKAIGVASNNLGNCMLAMYRTIKERGRSEEEICGMKITEIIAKGTAYFRDAIKLGEEAYDKFYEEQGWSGNCLVFMQHLSSRYFNRAMFLLTVKPDHRWPEEAHRLGLRDLDIAKNMDVEVEDQCIEVGFDVNVAEQLDLMLSRIRGLLTLKSMGYRDEWDTEDLIIATFAKLKAAIKDPSLDFFRDISPAGRMQQFDTELIKDALLEGRRKDAAIISIRMLIEDEYTFHEAQSIAIQALVDFVEQAEGQDCSEVTPEAESDLLRFQKETEIVFAQIISRRIAHCQKLDAGSLASLKTTKSTRFSGSCKVSASTMEVSHRGDFTMEIF